MFNHKDFNPNVINVGLHCPELDTDDGCRTIVFEKAPIENFDDYIGNPNVVSAGWGSILDDATIVEFSFHFDDSGTGRIVATVVRNSIIWDEMTNAPETVVTLGTAIALSQAIEYQDGKFVLPTGYTRMEHSIDYPY